VERLADLRVMAERARAVTWQVAKELGEAGDGVGDGRWWLWWLWWWWWS
jgi:hypothetical protein